MLQNRTISKVYKMSENEVTFDLGMEESVKFGCAEME